MTRTCVRVMAQPGTGPFPKQVLWMPRSGTAVNLGGMTDWATAQSNVNPSLRWLYQQNNVAVVAGRSRLTDKFPFAQC
jgi:hypothetical protein